MPKHSFIVYAPTWCSKVFISYTNIGRKEITEKTVTKYKDVPAKLTNIAQYDVRGKGGKKGRKEGKKKSKSKNNET